MHARPRLLSYKEKIYKSKHGKETHNTAFNTYIKSGVGGNIGRNSVPKYTPMHYNLVSFIFLLYRYTISVKWHNQWHHMPSRLYLLLRSRCIFSFFFSRHQSLDPLNLISWLGHSFPFITEFVLMCDVKCQAIHFMFLTLRSDVSQPYTSACGKAGGGKPNIRHDRLWSNIPIILMRWW